MPRSPGVGFHLAFARLGGLEYYILDLRHDPWDIYLMEITEKQYKSIPNCLPRHPVNASFYLKIMNQIPWAAEPGCIWRGTPKHFVNRRPIYTRMNRWY
jgi:hypothetical protein